MISKKWRNLDKNLIENYKNNNDEIDNEDNNYKREIIIVDVFNSEEEDEGEIQEKNNKKKEEIIFNRFKLKLPKLKPILNVDPNSINLVNYIVNSKNVDLYKKYSNYYRGYDTGYQYQPRNYTYFCTSHFNSNNANKQVNYLARGNDYTYNYTSRYNIINKRNYHQPYKLNRKNNITYSDYLKEKYNNNLIYSQNFEEKPNYIKSISIRKYQTIDNHESLKKNKINWSGNQRINRRYSWRNLQGERNTYVINDYNNNLQPVILIENKNRNNNSIDSKLNYIYI